MLLLGNDDVDALLTVTDCTDAIESVYREADAGMAAHRPRATFQVAQGPNRRYALATMEGVSIAAGHAAIRLRSDFVLHDPGRGREQKYAGAPGSFCGLVLLFDIHDAAPVAILNDGRLQQLRVGATAAVAAKRMARADSRTLGIIGSGWQARSHAEAYRSVLPIERIRVFSPDPGRRGAYADEMRARLGIEVHAVASAREAVEASDVVALCTNATRPVIEASWLTPGAHVSSVRHRHEAGPDLLARADRVVIHVPPDATSYRAGETDRAGLPDAGSLTPTPRDLPALSDLLAGREPGRTGNDEITYFLNNVGTGLQFAACASMAYRRARERGLGRELPTEWFLQDISD